MAKRWQPKLDDPIGHSEPVGRRLFDEPKLAGTGDQPDFKGLQLSHFWEKRGREVSLDRLGRSNVEKKVRDYLIPRCDLHGTLTDKPRSFDGWAVIRARNLTKQVNDFPDWELHTSPEEKRDDIEFSNNEYHAHAICREDIIPRRSALYLRYRFEKYGHVEHRDSGDVVNARSAGLLGKIGRALKEITERLFRSR